MGTAKQAVRRTAPRSRATQHRGDQRRAQLLGATHALLERHEIGELTFAAVCSEAGVPAGSARFFYKDMDALLRALLRELGEKHDAALTRPFRPADVATWRALVDCLIDRSVRFQRANPVFAKLSIGGRTPPELKRMDRDADRARAAFLLAALEEHFVVPRIPDRERIVYYIVETADLALMLSMSESGSITPVWQQHAKTATATLLSHYFGENLLPRPAQPDSTAAK